MDLSLPMLKRKMDKIFWPLIGLGIIFLILISPVYLQIAIGLVFILFTVLWLQIRDVVDEREEFKKKLAHYMDKLELTIT